MSFQHLLETAGITKPVLRKRLGPFIYERDEWRFWHRLYVRNWQFAVMPDRRTPSFYISSPRGEWRVESTWTSHKERASVSLIPSQSDAQ